MKNTKLFSRVLSLLLSILLLLSLGVPALAETADSGQYVSWEKISNEEAGVSLPLREAVESEDESLYASTDKVRVSIVLEGKSTIDAGFSTLHIADNASAMSYRSSLKTQQTAIAKVISSKALGGKTLDVVWNLTLAANIISANVPYGAIEKIKGVLGVSDVIIENSYSPCVSSVGGNDPAMATSSAMTGSTLAWANGYTGAGSRIAIIDTGLDTDHQSFSEEGFKYSLKQNAEKLGMSYEEYSEGLNLLTSSEISSKWSDLNFSSVYSRSYGNTVFSSKVPFGANYVDASVDITHDNDSQGEHGSHISGIAAANSYIYSGFKYYSALEKVNTQGIAPDAQILVMKVFGKSGGAYDSDYMAAIEDAIILGADAINLSLGSSNAGASTDSTYQDILDSLANSDTVLTASAGNSGTWADGTSQGYLYSDGVNFDTVGSPASYTNSFAVASVENNGSTGSYLKVDDDLVFYCENTGFSNKSITTIAGTHEFIYINSVGTEDEFSALAGVIKGKIAICNRGVTSFSEKMDAAAAAGAIACIVVNNEDGVIDMDLSDATSSIPCVSLLQSDGELLRAAGEFNETGNYYSGSLTVGSDITSVAYDSDYYTMSSFSSMGVPGNLTLKPEITAPGGNIYSVNGAVKGGKAYEVMSGTSMAAPQIAGMTALVAQYIRESGLDTATGLSPRQLTQSLLMSTAVPLIEEDSGSYYSVMRQGAGLANVDAAISSGSYIMMNADATESYADGKVKAELGDDPERSGSYSFSFQLNNITDSEKSFELSSAFFTQDYFTNDTENGEYTYTDTMTCPLSAAVSWSVDGKAVEAKLGDALSDCDFDGDGTVTNDDGQALLDYVVGNREDISGKDVADIDADGDIDTYDVYLFFVKFSSGVTVVPANGSVTVTVSFTLLDIADYDDCGAYVEGYVFAEELTDGEGVKGDSHSIPVLGYYGGWDESSMFDVGSYVEYASGEEARRPYMYAAEEDNAFSLNSYLISHAGEAGSYYFGGNPYVADESYMPERNAVNSENGDSISKVSFASVRNAAASAFTVTSGGSVIESSEYGPIDCAYYYEDAGEWYYSSQSVTLNFSPAGLDEGTRFTMSFSLAPEYYLNEDGSVDWASLNDAASLSLPVIVDNTAPEITDVQMVTESTDGSYAVNVEAFDNQYIAAVALYDDEGNTLGIFGSDAEAEAGESGEYSFELEELGQRYIVQVYDYAGNCASYKINLDGEEAAGEISVSLSDTELELLKNSSYKLTATVSPWGTPDESVTWVSDNEAVATVNSNGIVKALSLGTANITATSNADKTKSAVCKVSVITVPVTVYGVLQDADGIPQFFSWNLDEEESWTGGAELETDINAFAYDWLWEYSYDDSDDSEYYACGYVMNTSGYMYSINMDTGETVGTSENSVGLGTLVSDMDFAYSYNNDNDADVIFGISGSYLVYSEEPLKNTFYEGWDLSEELSENSGASAFTAIAWGGKDDDGADCFYLLDNAGYMWVIAYDGENTDVGCCKTDLDLDWPDYDGSQYCSLVLGDDGNFYLSYFTGDTNEIYKLTYDEAGDSFFSMLLCNVGDGVWPCALSEVCVNSSEENSTTQKELPEAVICSGFKTVAKNLTVCALELPEKGIKGSLNSLASVSGSSANSISKLPAVKALSLPSASENDEFLYVDVTVSDAEGKDTLSTNGLVEVSFNEKCLELVSIESYADYFSAKDNVFGYADLEGIASGEAVAKLTFKVLDISDVTVSIKTLEANNDKSGYTEVLDCAHAFKHENTEVRNAVPATCTEEGYTGDVYCADCGKLLEKGEAIEKLPHNYGEWELVKAPGCKTSGLEKCVCTDCGAEKTREVDPAGHSADPFSDISSSGYHDGIIEAAELGIVGGYPDGSFRPSVSVTRGQFVTMLWRLAGRPNAGDAAGFKDVEASSPYAAAILWANGEGIAKGYTADTFKPNQTITRAQMATFMYRYLKNIVGYDFGEVAEVSFADKGSIAPSYTEAVNAIVSSGIMNGTSATTFAPNATANRGMAATVMVRLYHLVYPEAK